jgi:hypothetical protein
LVPLGINIAIKLVPKPVMEECRLKALSNKLSTKPKNWIAAGVILATWVIFAVFGISLFFRYFKR